MVLGSELHLKKFINWNFIGIFCFNMLYGDSNSESEEPLVKNAAGSIFGKESTLIWTILNSGSDFQEKEQRTCCECSDWWRTWWLASSEKTCRLIECAFGILKQCFWCVYKLRVVRNLLVKCSWPAVQLLTDQPPQDKDLPAEEVKLNGFETKKAKKQNN